MRQGPARQSLAGGRSTPELLRLLRHWHTSRLSASHSGSSVSVLVTVHNLTSLLRNRASASATPLLDAASYAADELAGLYVKRWWIEVDLRHVKTTMGMDAVHCRSVEGVPEGLTMCALVYSLVRLIVHADALAPLTELRGMIPFVTFIVAAADRLPYSPSPPCKCFGHGSKFDFCIFLGGQTGLDK